MQILYISQGDPEGHVGGELQTCAKMMAMSKILFII